jgi:Na+-transporting NADH:ubiquinone oxidoreductase subunit C
MQNKDSIKNILMIGIGLCLVCAAVISIIAVGLKELQKNNAILDQQKKIVAAADLQEFYGSTEVAFDSIEEIIIDIEEGLITNDSTEKYDLSKELRDPSRHIVLSSIEDIATIKKRENFSKIFLEYREGQLNTVILPVRGYGLWGILYGYLAISSDLNTIVGLEFYEHKETPGLGAEVDNPKWKALWRGKKIYDENGEILIKVVKGKVDNSNEMSTYEVDGLSGATLTSNGVSNLLAYWLSDSGFKKFLNNLKQENING